jgi:hypothetical protein
VSLERGGSCLENREYGHRDLSRWPRGTLYSQKLATTSPRSGGRSVGIVRSRTQTMEFFFIYICHGTWARLSGVIRKSYQFVCVCARSYCC